MAEKKKVLVLIDANSLIHRAFHALPPLSTPKGQMVNAVYGFFMVFFKVLGEFKPNYVAAAFDAPGPTKREKVFAEYKAKRVKAPDELYAQIPLIKEALRELNVPAYEKPGFEADDYIGTVAKLASRSQAQPPLETIIISGDQDAFQLINGKTKVYTMRKGMQDTVLYDVKAVEKKFGGLRPEQIVDYKALRGDPSDNIPGVTGIGEKTAIELLNEFDSLEHLYDVLEHGEVQGKIKPRIAQLLGDYKEQAFLSQGLATIERSAPIQFRLQDLAWEPEFSKIKNALERFGFRSLLERLQIQYGQEGLRGRGVQAVLPGAGREKESSGQALSQKIEQLYRDKVFSKKIYELEKRLTPVLRAMEETGIQIDRPYFRNLAKEMGREVEVSASSIYKIAKKPFNVNSTQQLSAVLFEQLGLSPKGLKKTPKGVVSTASPELEKLMGAHPIVLDILKYRELQKLYTTYVLPLPEMADEKSRIHTHFDQLGAATGRISSSQPNLQNIPVQGEWGKKIRRGFVAPEGFQFVSLDYSQMELRIASHMAREEKMMTAFREQEDIHRTTAAEVFGVRPEEVTEEMRYRAKALNFGVLYGMGARGFAQSAGISFEEAQEFMENYFTRFPKILQYVEETKEFARRHGYTETLAGRRRYLPDVNSSTPHVRAAAERMAQNHPIQGTAADIIKTAMVEIADRVRAQESHWRMIVQIHDELLIEARNDIMHSVAPRIAQVMEAVPLLQVPLRVETRRGENWGDLEK